MCIHSYIQTYTYRCTTGKEEIRGGKEWGELKYSDDEKPYMTTI